MANHLAGETSPYLLHHADNPVDWYPWGPEALSRARDEDKPIFLSIGYSACHWCHVMERESFTDPETAVFLNDHFISIKVDREERPDLDAIYMEAVTALTGRGGWPLSAWLTADGVPFYGGTYFPKSPRFGMPSFRQVLEKLVEAWETRRGELDQAAATMRAHLVSDQGQPDERGPAGAGAATPGQIIERALRSLQASFDPVNGGWGGAPKFPQPSVLEALLARLTLGSRPELQVMIETTLDAMAAGGIYDQLGGGFHRYSTDERWLVPHFEKMLYDNAQLARCYLHAWQLFGKPRYRMVAEETLDYLLREMSHSGGGFFSAEDADSEGREGAFFVWTLEDIRRILAPEEADLMAATYGMTAQGNFEGANILHVVVEAGESPTSWGRRARSSAPPGRTAFALPGTRRSWPDGTAWRLLPWPKLLEPCRPRDTAKPPNAPATSYSASCCDPATGSSTRGRTAGRRATASWRTTPVWWRGFSPSTRPPLPSAGSSPREASPTR